MKRIGDCFETGERLLDELPPLLGDLLSRFSTTCILNQPNALAEEDPLRKASKLAKLRPAVPRAC